MGKRKLTQLSDSEEDEKATRESGGGSDEDSGVEAKPLGEVIKRLGRGKLEKRYYQAFELDGNRYELEDPVLVTPEERNQKPYVAIIKEIKQSKDGGIAVTGQWFYRPEEAEKKGGGSWVANDSRELFYSFHRDEVAAESVMHKCVVHFIPANKQAPLRSKHPGFIVRMVYDTVEKKLWRLTDKDYEDSKQAEIDLLVQKTRDALGDLLDIEPEEAAAEQEETEKIKKQLRRRNVPPLNITREENLPGELSAREGFGRPDTPGTCLNADAQGGLLSEGYAALHECNALTGNKARDKWLDKIVQAVKYVCNVTRHTENAGKLNEDKVIDESSSHTTEHEAHQNSEEATKAHLGASESKNQENLKVDGELLWPKAAVTAVASLERNAYETLGSDMHKYNIKMRQLEFNLKNSTVLAQRLLKKELKPSKVFNMSPAELKDGLTAEEKSAQEPEEPETMQMADVRCTICGEKKVGVKDIIHVGYGDRYQLECLKCGNSWYSSRDSISSLTIQTANPTVGTAPWATSKFEEFERELLSPREPERLGAQEAAVQGTGLERPVLEQPEEASRSLPGIMPLPISAEEARNNTEVNAAMRSQHIAEAIRAGNVSTPQAREGG